jgi:hypothetical protein
MPVDLEATPAEPLKNASKIYSRPRITTIAAMLLVNRENPTELL